MFSSIFAHGIWWVQFCIKLCIGAVDVNEVCLPCVVVFLACKLVLTVHPCIYPFYVCHRFVHVHCSQGHVLAAEVSHKKHTS